MAYESAYPPGTLYSRKVPGKSPKTRSSDPKPATPRTISNFTKVQQETLQHDADLLHLFHHRNKNQHRRSTWYRHFSTFRKQLNLLVSDISELNAVPATHLEKLRKSGRDEQTRERVEKRLAFWRDVMVPKWHLVFGQVVVDGRFAALGVVLVAVLGEVCGVVGITRVFEEMGDEEVRGVIEAFGREMEDGGDVEGEGGGEDVGTVVRREHADSEERLGSGGVEQGQRLTASGASDAESAEEVKGNVETQRTSTKATTGGAASKRAASAAKPAKAKKKRKGGDAIDELFRGLG